MGYTHYWDQTRTLSEVEWTMLLGEARRIIAKAQRGCYYSGRETSASDQSHEVDGLGVRRGLGEAGAWRTFPNFDQPIPHADRPILLGGPDGSSEPVLDENQIVFNGRTPEDYETFSLLRQLPNPASDGGEPVSRPGFCKTEYRPYDAVVVSILAAIRAIAPDAIKVSSDGGPDAIRYMF